MTNKLKKSLATLLAASMVLSMMSTAAFANEPENEELETQPTVCEVCKQDPCACEKDEGEPQVCEICGKDPCECEEEPEEELCEHEWNDGEAVEGGTKYTCALCGESHVLEDEDNSFEIQTLEETEPQADGVETNGVARVGNTTYVTLQEAIIAANSGTDKTVTMLKNQTVETWNQIWDLDGVTIDGQGCTLTVGSIYSNGNGNYLLYNATNLDIHDLKVILTNGGSGFDVGNSMLSNVSITGAKYGVATGSDVTITGCTFTDNQYAIYTNDRGQGTGVEVTNNIFTGCRAIILRSDEVFTGNTVEHSDTMLSVDTANATVTKNKFSGTGKLSLYADTNIKGNAILCGVKVGSGVTADLSDNYWGENVPTDLPDGITVASRYTVWDEASKTASVPAVGPDAVAEVEGKGYATLQDAINACPENGTVTLLADVETETMIDATKSITIDGGAEKHSVTRVSNGGNVVFVINESEGLKVTFKNMKIDSSPLKERGISVYGAKNIELTLDNVELSASHYALNIASLCDNAKVDITGSTLTGWCAFQTWSPNSVITAKNSTLIGINDKGYNADGWNIFQTIVVNTDATNSKVVVENSTIKASIPEGDDHNEQMIAGVRNGSSVVELTGCTIEAEGTYRKTNSEETVALSPDNVRVNISSDGKLIVDGKTYTGIPGFAISLPLQEMEEAAVAEVNGVNCFTLQAAIDNCPEGGTVKVLANSSEDLVLPLKSLTLTSEGETKPVLTGKVDFAAGAMPEGTQVTIENLAFENTSIRMTAWTQTTNLEEMGGLTIRNNTFTGSAAGEGNIYAIHINNNDGAVNNLIITGNVFDGCGTNNGGCVYATTCGELVVTENTFKNSAMNALTLTGKQGATYGTAATTSATIANNIFDGWAVTPADRSDGRAMRLSNFDCDIDLTGNSFVSSNLPEEYIKLTGLAGGKKANVNKCYWGGEAPAENKLLGVDTVSSYYVDAEMTQLVVSDGIVAEVSGVYYTTLQDAIAAAQAGDTVTLLKDVEITEGILISRKNDITLDGGNHTITATGDIHGIQVWRSTGVKIENITITHTNKDALLVNQDSEVIATNLTTSGSGWGAVNVDKNSKFTLVSGTLNEDNKIWTDDEQSTVTVPESWNWVQIGDQKFYTTGLSISLDRTTANLYSNTTPNTVTLTLTAPEGAKVEWTTSDAAVATVADGVVTAVANGTATITVTVGSMMATCTVTVSTYTAPYIPPYVPPTTDEELDENDTPLVETPFNFVDVVLDRDWFYGDVKTLFEMGLINGMGQNAQGEEIFEPYFAANRAMVATMLHRLAGEVSVKDLDITVVDVTPDDWYHDAAVWAYANGVFGGYDDGSFCGEAIITREQLAVVLYRYATSLGLDTTARADLSSFADAELVSDWAVDSMQWAVAAGLIGGHDDGRLAAQESANRAQLSAMFVRFSSLLPTDEGNEE